MLQISIPIGVVITLAVVGWMIVNGLLVLRRQRKLKALRTKQEAARLRALDKALRPPLLARLGWPFKRPK